MAKEALYFNFYGFKYRQYETSSHFSLMASAVTVIVVAIVAIMVAVVTIVMVAIVTVVASMVTASVSTGELFGGFC